MSVESQSKKTVKIEPQDGPQKKAFESDADIIIFGGGNGGGKTWTLIHLPIRMFNDPAFSGVMFRRTNPELEQPKGIKEKTQDIYPKCGARWTKYGWVLPAGGRMSLSHMQFEKHRKAWDGAELTYAGFDQVEDFTQKQFLHIVGRMRSAKSLWKPQIVATCNPTKRQDHWLRQMIDWWIDDDGFPIPERDGKIRYFFREENDGWEWVDKGERRIVADDDGNHHRLPPKSVTFIHSRVFDNPALLENDPEYLVNLNSLDTKEKERRLGGNWNVSEGDNKFENHNILRVSDAEFEEETDRSGRWIRYWDLADTQVSKKKAKKSQSETASSRGTMTWEVYTYCQTEGCRFWDRGKRGGECPACMKDKLRSKPMPVLWVENVKHGFWEGSNKRNWMRAVAERDGPETIIAIEREGGTGGKEIASQYKHDVFDPEYRVVMDSPGKKGKESRSRLWLSAAEQGRVRMKNRDWTSDALEQINSFGTGGRCDIVDSISGLWKMCEEYCRFSAYSPNRKVATSSGGIQTP